MKAIKKGAYTVNAESSSRKKYIILLLVCIFHALLLLFFMTYFKKDNAIKIPDENNQDNDLRKDWAARIPPIIFYDDEPDHPPVVQQSDTELFTEQDEKQLISEIVEHEPLPEPESEKLANASLPEDNASETKEKILQPKESQRTAIEKVEEATQREEKKSVQNKKEKKVVQKKAQKKKLNLAELTKMYNQQINNIPVGDMFLQGSTDRMPPDKQISFERYKSKLNQIIDDMYKIYGSEMGIVPSGLSIKIYVAMDKKGAFRELYLAQSSGYPLIDKCVLKIYREASDRFPPIPKGLDERLFKGFIVLYSTTRNRSGHWLPF